MVKKPNCSPKTVVFLHNSVTFVSLLQKLTKIKNYKFQPQKYTFRIILRIVIVNMVQILGLPLVIIAICYILYY